MGLVGFPRFDYIIKGILNGFRIGINEVLLKYPNLIANDPYKIPLSREERKAVGDWLIKGVKKGYISGPFLKDFNFPWKLYCAPIFVRPKPVGWRPIVHLSHNMNGLVYSVNDLLCEYMKTVQYISFREVVNMVNHAGKGAYIFLIDAQDAYYRVPIHPDDWKYNGLFWDNFYWVFTSLQMGLSSSPRIYTLFADAVEYICCKKYPQLCFYKRLQMLRHYIDDFFAILKNYNNALDLYNKLYKLFIELGIPTREDKCKPPATRNKILGWEYDTILRKVFIPQDKRSKILNYINPILKNKHSDKKTLERLVGNLQNSSLIIFPGKAFVRRIEAVLHLPRWEYFHNISISNYVLDDLRWWKKILMNDDACGTSFDLLLKLPSDGDFDIVSDAAKTIGVGGFCRGVNAYFQLDWKDTIRFDVEKSYGEFDISTLELIGSMIGVLLWKSQFRNCAINIHNDNPSAAMSIRTKAPQLWRSDLQALVRLLASIAIEDKFYFWGQYSLAKDDDEMKLADGLSRFSLEAREQVVSNDWIDCSKNAMNICNELFKYISRFPILKRKVDINDNIREEYKILLHERFLKYTPKNDLTLIRQFAYDIRFKQY